MTSGEKGTGQIRSVGSDNFLDIVFGEVGIDVIFANKHINNRIVGWF